MAFESAQRNIDQQQAAMLSAMAEAGSQGRAAFEEGQKGINSGKQAATQAALARAQQIGAPIGAGDANAAQIATPYDRQIANSAGMSNIFGQYNQARTASHNNYMSEVNASVPIAKAAAQKVLDSRILAETDRRAKQSKVDEQELRDNLIAQAEIDAELAAAAEAEAGGKAQIGSDRYNQAQADAVAATNAYNAARKAAGPAASTTGAVITASKKQSLFDKVKGKVTPENALKAAFIVPYAGYKAGKSVIGGDDNDTKRMARMREEDKVRASIEPLRQKSIAAGQVRDLAKQTSLSAGAESEKAAAARAKVSDPVLATRAALTQQGYTPAEARRLTSAKFTNDYEAEVAPPVAKKVAQSAQIPVATATEIVSDPAYGDQLSEIDRVYSDEGKGRDEITAELKAAGVDSDRIKVYKSYMDSQGYKDASTRLNQAKTTKTEKQLKAARKKSKPKTSS